MEYLQVFRANAPKHLMRKCQSMVQMVGACISGDALLVMPLFPEALPVDALLLPRDK